jgi:phage/conjugal plasmid C-4 type zinc finger TraR family protein
MDRAQAREEEMRGDAINEHRRRHPTYADSARECRVCDEAIPEARRKALPGVNTCIECQADLERQQGWGLF